MPPKKDAFADLFLSATGNSPSSSLPSLSNLSLRDQKPKTQSVNTWSNLDILSPTNGPSPQLSTASTPRPTSLPAADFDPFSVFGSASPASNGSSSNQPAQPPRPNPQTSSGRARQGEISLLDDDFTDAFEPVILQPVPEPARRRPVDELAQQLPPTPKHTTPARSATPVRSATPQGRAGSSDSLDRRDTVVAGLVDIGFPIDVANRAIDQVGPDLQSCVNFIMSGGQSRDSAAPLRNKSKSPPELGASLQNLSADIFKKASWFLDKSKTTVLKNINQLQQGQLLSNDPSMPQWMRNQQKYKSGAVERKGNGEVFEDYGDDEDNINSEEIQRIMRQQKQRERERQKERFDTLGRSNSNKSSRESLPEPHRQSSDQVSALGRNSPAQRPRLPTRPSLTPANDVSRASKPQALNPPSDIAAPRPKPKQEEPEVDLLGLGGGQPLLRAERFKQSSGEGSTYVSPSRRRPARAARKERKATAEVLNAFQQSDYETFKSKAATSFTQGDYGDALTAYTRCLEALPITHELRIVIFSNLAITQIKLGNYKTAKLQCEEGIALVADNADDDDWIINEKAIKYWYIKLLTRKAESLEMLESFSEALECYLDLVTKHGVTDKKVMDAKRRVGNIVNPPKPKPKAAPKPQLVRPTVVNTEQVQKIRKQHNDEKVQDELKFKLHDQVHDKISAWTNGKEDNLRSLLMSLNEIVPARLGFPFLQKPLTINDLMLTKKVKINYMKVISSIHPDKLNKFELEDQMICQAVFVALNKAWDSFKEQNGIN